VSLIRRSGKLLIRVDPLADIQGGRVVRDLREVANDVECKVAA